MNKKLLPGIHSKMFMNSYFCLKFQNKMRSKQIKKFLIKKKEQMHKITTGCFNFNKENQIKTKNYMVAAMSNGNITLYHSRAKKLGLIHGKCSSIITNNETWKTYVFDHQTFCLIINPLFYGSIFG